MGGSGKFACNRCKFKKQEKNGGSHRKNVTVSYLLTSKSSDRVYGEELRKEEALGIRADNRGCCCSDRLILPSINRESSGAIDCSLLKIELFIEVNRIGLKTLVNQLYFSIYTLFTVQKKS